MKILLTRFKCIRTFLKIIARFSATAEPCDRRLSRWQNWSFFMIQEYQVVSSRRSKKAAESYRDNSEDGWATVDLTRRQRLFIWRRREWRRHYMTVEDNGNTTGRTKPITPTGVWHFKEYCYTSIGYVLPRGLCRGKMSVCSSVCHTPVLCVNGYTYPQSFSTIG